MTTAKPLKLNANGDIADFLSTDTIPSSNLPNPTASTLGGIESYASVSHQWINQISTSGVPSSAQPAFSDISGSATSGQLPGDVAYNDLNNQWGTDQTPGTGGTVNWGSAAKPFATVTVSNYLALQNTSTGFANAIQSSATAGRTCTIPDANTNTIQPKTSATSHNWVQYVDSSGVQHLSQPASTDISGLGTAATENLTSIITDNGSGGLTIGSAQVIGGMIQSSVALAGNPTTTTATVTDNSTKIATTAFVDNIRSATNITEYSLFGAI